MKIKAKPKQEQNIKVEIEKIEDVVENIIDEKIEEAVADKVEELAEEIQAEAEAEPEMTMADLNKPFEPETKIEPPQEMDDGVVSDTIRNAMNKIKWQKFTKKMLDFNLETGRSCVIFGSSYSGKTHFLLNNIIPNYCSKKVITLMQADNVQSYTYKNVPKHILKVNKYLPNVLKAFKYINSKTKNKYNFMSITDDIVCGLRHNDVIRKTLLSWRNSKISSVNLFQSLTLINKSERSSISYIVLKQVNDLNTVRDIIEFWCLQSKVFYDLKMADRLVLYREIMKDKNCAILIDNIKGKIRFIKHK
jgi:hypothetical protein